MCTDFNLTPEYPRKGYGDFGGNAVLIAFTEDWSRLTMLFFEGKKGEKQALFAKWVCGEIPESVEGAAAPLP
jgi:hypothetical protein